MGPLGILDGYVAAQTTLYHQLRQKGAARDVPVPHHPPKRRNRVSWIGWTAVIVVTALDLLGVF